MIEKIYWVIIVWAILTACIVVVNRDKFPECVACRKNIFMISKEIENNLYHPNCKFAEVVYFGKRVGLKEYYERRKK